MELLHKHEERLVSLSPVTLSLLTAVRQTEEDVGFAHHQLISFSMTRLVQCTDVIIPTFLMSDINQGSPDGAVNRLGGLKLICKLLK